MAYNVAWDESLPDGDITAADDLDTELQNLKTSLRERLEQVIPDFGDDLVDPKVLIKSLFYLLVAGPETTTTTTVSSEDLDFTEKFNSGDFTVAGKVITFDKAGKYLAIMMGEGSITTPDGGESIIMRLLGTATIDPVTALWVVSGTTSQSVPLSGMTFISAAVGDTVSMRGELHNSVGSNSITLARPRLFLFRLGD